jgi:CelD/BcsL family acetyltransferase involved in cellulose biosynthesis
MSFAATQADAPSRRAGAPARPFAAVEIHAEPGDARHDWLDLEPAAGSYQSLRFVAAWAEAARARLCVAVARDATGRAVALLPLQLESFGPLTSAGFAGGVWANYHMGLFRPGLDWSADDLTALLRAAGRAAGIDLFAFINQPARWEGAGNPLAPLFGGRAPSPAFASALAPVHPQWLDAHFSRATQKKLRKKARKLEAFGPVRHARAADAQEAERFLAACLAHRAARAGVDAFASAQVLALLRGLIASGAMEMHALLAGERIAATFGALAHGRRLSGLVVSYDGAAEIAAATPGELLLIEVVRDAMARGFATFDLGVGESRYKREICEIEEILSDSALGVSPLGRAAAPVWLAARAGVGAIKRRPWLFSRVQRLRRALARGDDGAADDGGAGEPERRGRGREAG